MPSIRENLIKDLNKINPEIIKKIKSDNQFNIFDMYSTYTDLRCDFLIPAMLLSKEKFLNKNKLIEEFYEEANIHDLYLKYKDYYEKELEKHRKILT